MTSADQPTAIFLVNRSETQCSNCNEGTLVDGVTHHADVAAWTPRPGEGCGARFIGIAADNRAITAEDLRQMRPDLPVVPHPRDPNSTQVCGRCSGSGIDPEHSDGGCTIPGEEQPPALEPCIACQFPPA